MPTEIEKLREAIAEKDRALEPFSVFAGPLFERNFNRTDVLGVFAADGVVHSITAGHFFDARAARTNGGQ